MEIHPKSIRQSIKGRLSRVYVIVGSDIALANECRDAVREIATKQGHDEFFTYFTQETPWNEIIFDSRATSLFGSDRFFEVILDRRGFDRRSSDGLNTYMKNPSEDLVMLVRGSNGVDWRTRQTKWFKDLLKHDDVGLIVAEPMQVAEVANWISEWAHDRGFQLARDACLELASLNEGNLEQVRQELMRLQHLYEGEGSIVSVEDLTQLDGGSFSVFALTDAAVRGNRQKVHRVIHNLQSQGEQVPRILAVLLVNLRRTMELSKDRSTRMPQVQRRSAEQLLRRLRIDRVVQLFNECAVLDSKIKGIHRGDPWLDLEHILLSLSNSIDVHGETYAKWTRIDYEATES